MRMGSTQPTSAWPFRGHCLPPALCTAPCMGMTVTNGSKLMYFFLNPGCWKCFWDNMQDECIEMCVTPLSTSCMTSDKSLNPH